MNAKGIIKGIIPPTTILLLIGGIVAVVRIFSSKETSETFSQAYIECEDVYS